jgi:hypothetical protein
MFSRLYPDNHVTAIVVNPTNASTVTLADYTGDFDVYIYTATEPTLNSTLVDVNGHTMLLAANGTPDALPAKRVTTIDMPAQSYGFVVTADVHPACK